ncbi:hypothetical protein [Sulfurisphaera ohwakuensis]|uniref:hypothetical protein n=1 Tax=Sulfurisphaera ohwakuensis TaxID=69656 RepID=UPI0036F36948
MSKIIKSMIVLLILINGISMIHFQTYSFSADPKLLFWLVPWGPSNGTYEFLIPYLPNVMVGIVFPFNTYNLGNESVSLQQALSCGNNEYWISTQISKLNTIYERSNLIFINFFLTTSHWRGYLTSVTPAQIVLLNYTLHKIANITNDGKKLVVGISEMNDLNDYGYYEVYSLIQQILPNAKLFYYTDLGQSVSSIESVFEYLQFEGITLNYLGYDVYPYPSYNYMNGVVCIPSNYVSQISELQNFANQQGINFFIGEVGFRDGDIKGYINPASTSYIEFNSTLGYNDTIHYYEDVISQLESMGVILIGIWNYNGWNGDPFGLWVNPDFNALLEYVGIKPIEIATIDVISTFPYYYINSSLYYVNKTYTIVLPANITFVKLKYLNNTARVLLASINGTFNLSSIIINKEGSYMIIANYITQYYVNVSPQVIAYINGVKEEFVSGWYNSGTQVTVIPQEIQIGKDEIYNITKAYRYTIDYPMVIEVPYVVEYYVKLNLRSIPAIINGTNSTLVSGYYPEGTDIEIPEYYYINQTARLKISASLQKFVLNSPIDVYVSETFQWLVKIVLPNGTIVGWYNNDSIISLPKVIEVNGTTYLLNETNNEVIVTGPLVLHPHYVSITTITSTSSTVTTTSQTTTLTTTSNTNTVSITVTNTSVSTFSSPTSSSQSNLTGILPILLLVVIAIIAVMIIVARR